MLTFPNPSAPDPSGLPPELEFEYHKISVSLSGIPREELEKLTRELVLLNLNMRRQFCEFVKGQLNPLALPKI
jgi:hypothetical protein